MSVSGPSFRRTWNHRRVESWLLRRQAVSWDTTLLGLESDCYFAVRPLLDHPLFSVRSRLATLLGSKYATYGKHVAQDLVGEHLSRRAVRTLLDAFTRAKAKPLRTPVELDSLYLLNRDGWGLDRVLLLIADEVNGIYNTVSREDGSTEADDLRAFQELVVRMRRLESERLI